MSDHTSLIKKEQVYFPELDGLRFFAFFLVFLHHSTLFVNIPFLKSLSDNGWLGVDLFFVLSAFLFTKLLITEFESTQTICFKKFYVRRIFRIWPLYFLMVSGCLLYYKIMNAENISDSVTGRAIGLLTFTDNIFCAFNDYNTISFTRHLWTIGFEEQFYIIIPLLIIFLVRMSPKNRGWILLAVFLALNTVRFMMIMSKVPHPVIWVLPVTHFESILLGIIIGFGGLDFLKDRKPELLVAVILAGFLLLTQLPPIETNSLWLFASYSLIGIITALLLSLVRNNQMAKNILTHPVLVYLGKRSYGLYVFHLLANFISVAIILKIPGFEKSTPMQFSISLGLTILLSHFSYIYIEKPFLHLKKNFEVVSSRPV